MVTSKVIVVFVLPIIFSVILGSAVLNGILEKPDRELHLWPTSSSHNTTSVIENGAVQDSNAITITGLLEEYSTLEPVEVQLQITDPSFDCGDLYITIYTSSEDMAIIQNGFFTQCFEEDGLILPIGDNFSEIIDVPGSYVVVAEMISEDLDTISARGVFTIK